MTLVISKGLTLDNGTRAAAIAGVSPTLDYRFAREKREIETVSLTDKLTFTGGNQGTFTGSDGFIQSATTNVPRFDHDPLSRQSLGLLSEVERTNSLLRSEEFDNASWAKNRSSIALKAAVAPSGLIAASKFIEDTSIGNTHTVLQSTSYVAGVTYTASVYVKTAERTYINMELGGSVAFGTATSATFSLLEKSVFFESNSPATSLIDVGSGWQRLSVSKMASSTANSNVILYLSNNSGARVYTGDGTSGIFLWGAQLEAGSIPSSYIPTTTTAVTRTADSAVIDGTGVLTGTYTMVEKPAGCAVVSGTNINLQPGFTAERVMVFPAALDAGQITAIRGAM
jgi:hypothetical protein